jgi:DNA polymerase-1
MKVVYEQIVDEVLEHLATKRNLAIDTETTGLYPYHGDKLFSIAISDSQEDYYFNFIPYPNLPENMVLRENTLQKINLILGQNINIRWCAHNAKYDLAILNNAGITFRGEFFCTKVLSRLQYNEAKNYSLDGCAKRALGAKKDSAVEEYIKANGLYTPQELNGKTFKKPRYDLVPFELISKYACKDTRLSFNLAVVQSQKIREKSIKKGGFSLIFEVEKELTKVLFDMESTGAQLDIEYVDLALHGLNESMLKAEKEFKDATGRDFLLSGKVFAEIFEDEKDKWVYTEKGNPQFDKDILKTFDNPVAKTILAYKEAKAKYDFFHNFKFYADKHGVLHTNFDSAGTTSGRFSSSSPNLQNLTKSIDESGWVVRRAIVPREDYILAMIDYDQIEYRLMLDYCEARNLIKKVRNGLDVHSATAEVAGCSRTEAKMVNFLTLYGGGIEKLANALGCSETKAREIQQSIFEAAPEILSFKEAVISSARTRGYVWTWAGRILHFPKTCGYHYKAPNRLIQGGASDVIKKAMVDLYAFLRGKKSRMLLNIHDELVFEIHTTELDLLEDIKRIMEESYPYKLLPLTCGIEWSDKSLADKKPFGGLASFGKESGDSLQGENQTAN